MLKKITAIIMSLAIMVGVTIQPEAVSATYNGAISKNTMQDKKYLNATSDSDRRIVSVNLSDTSNEALAEDGSLYLLGSWWGDHEKLAEAANVDRYTPVKILSDVESVSAGFDQKGAITKNGDLYVWGNMWGVNDFGVLGNDKSERDYKFVPVKILSDVAFISYDTASWFIGGKESPESIGGAVTKDDSLYMWGLNMYGTLGDGTTEEHHRPVKVLSNVVSFQVKDGCAGAITKDGSLYMWGCNRDGRVGNGTTENCYTPVKVLSNVDFFHIGYICCKAVTKDGSLYIWGRNVTGQIGNGTTKDCYTPVKVLSDVTSVSMSDDHTGAITKDGSLYTWGTNYVGQLGDGTTKDRYMPVKVLSNVASINMDDYGYYNGAITKDGSLYRWGRNYDEKLGGGTIEDNYTPTKVLSDVVFIDYNNSSGCNIGAVTKDSDLYVWGTNSDGIIGDGTTEDRYKPVKILSNVNFFSFGNDCCGAVTKDGSLYMWGSNNNGQLGDGTTKDRHKPVKINFPSKSKNSQKITYHITGMKNKKVPYSSTFSLNAKTSGTGKLTYKSSNSKILSVNAKGEVKVNGYGPAYVKIKASGGNGYKAAILGIKLTAVPRQGKITRAEWQKTGVYFNWKPEKTADGYECAIAYNKKFVGQERKKTTKTEVILTKYKTNTKKMYIRVRTYKKVGKKTYYGSWSEPKLLKIKKSRKSK